MTYAAAVPMSPVTPSFAGTESRATHLYVMVAACAAIVYLGALWNRFAFDDVAIVVMNPLVGHLSGLWKAFAAPYWTPDLGGSMYRPLTIATFAVDRAVDGAAWLHAVNLAWHAAASVAVAALARRWTNNAGALAAGLLFAVHPVHVEAVANVVGRAESMAALFAVLAVYAAVIHESIAWSTAAAVLGLLSKENAAVVPGLVVWAWLLGFGRPDRRRIVVFVTVWVVVGAAYVAVRAAVRHPFSGLESTALMFVGESPVAVRLTAVAGLADVARLLVFPLTLRADYSPNERTLVTSPLDPRVVAGAVCFVVWSTLLFVAWKRGRRLEALGLGWIGIAYLPVANLLYPVGFYLAERTLYLPSAGLVLAVGPWLERLPPRSFRLVVAALVVLGGVRTARRVPVWRDEPSLTLSMLQDSPRSFQGPKRMAFWYLDQHEPAKALAAARLATSIFDRDATVYITGAVAAFAAGDARAADSLLVGFQRLCHQCPRYYRSSAAAAREAGYAAASDSLLARAERIGGP